jgi:glycosyltransferase involved in cell wall biosynthesis
VDEIVVVDGGSADGTVREALAAGARVVASSRRAGKGEAMEGALWRLPPAAVYVFADADLGSSAAFLEPLIEEVRSGRVDMAVAALPEPPSGGFGLVKDAARRVIRGLTGFDPREPLSGQRAMTAECLRACRPISGGFGVEIGLTIDAVRMGFRVVEFPAAVEHRYTSRDLAGFAHRGRQGIDATRAAVPRALAMR